MKRAPTIRPFAFLLTLMTGLLLVYSLLDLCRGSDEETIRVEVSLAKAHPDARGAQAWIGPIVADGRCLGAEEVSVEGAWKTKDFGNGLVFANERAGGALSFRAAFARITLRQNPWGAAVTIFRGSEIYGQRNLYTPLREGFFSSTLVHPPVRPAAASLLVVLLLAISYFLGPWKPHRSALPFLALSLTLIYLSHWAGQEAAVTNDSQIFWMSFEAFLAGRPHYFPPAYGAFIWITSLVPLPHGLVITLLQHLLTVGAILLLFLLARHWVTDEVAYVVALCAALAPATMIPPVGVMSETWTMFSMVAAIYLLGRTRSTLHGIAAGLAVAAATLTRVVPGAVFFPLFLWRAGQRPVSWRWLGAAGAAALLPVAAVVLYLGIRSGQPTLATSTGAHLYNHFVYQQKLLDRNGRETSELLSVMDGADPRDFTHWELAAFVAERSDMVVVDRFIDIALEAARQAGLLEHLAFDLELTFRNLTGNGTAQCAVAPSTSTPDRGLFSPPPSGSVHTVAHTSEALVPAFGTVWYYLAILWLVSCPLATFALARDRGLWLACWWIPLAYLAISSAVEYEHPRYNVAVAPLVIVQVLLVLFVVPQRLIAAARSRLGG